MVSGLDIDWDEVVENLGPRLFKYFSFRFSNEQADDLTQETLIRLVRKVQEGKFDADKGTLPMLGFGIAHYVALETKQLHRHEDIEDWQDSLSSADDLEKLIIDKDTAEKLKKKLCLLSSIEQQVLALHVEICCKTRNSLSQEYNSGV